MRSTVTEDARGFGWHDHLCWAFDDIDEFHSAVGEFLTEGIMQGQRVCYITDSDIDAMGLWDDLQDLDGTNRAAVQVHTLPDRYANGAVMEPVDQVQTYAAATADALAAGFRGLRIATEATSLARTPEQLDAVARYEHLIDRYMTDQPLSALCGFNRAELGEEAVAKLSCLHPTVNKGAPLFRLYASTSAAASLSGELDATSLDLFPMALQWADLRPTAGELVIDGSELAFIDHRSLVALADHARRWDATAVLQANLPSAARLIEILDLQDLRLEVPT